MKKLLFTIFMLCCTVSMCCELNCKDEQQDIYFYYKEGELSNKNSRSVKEIEATYNDFCKKILENV